MPATASPVRFPWYDVVEGTELQQGDFIAGCPVFHPSLGAVEGGAEVEVQLTRRTGIILTQSCDRALRADGRSHSEEVLFCSAYSFGELVHHRVFGKRAGWEEARKGRHPGFHVLNRCSVPGHEREFMLVDFTRVFTVDAGLVRELAATQGPRLRLNPPYREHLAQSFARFFMRVGLPVDIPPLR
jgi:hypothetical protein